MQLEDTIRLECTLRELDGQLKPERVELVVIEDRREGKVVKSLDVAGRPSLAWMLARSCLRCLGTMTLAERNPESTLLPSSPFYKHTHLDTTGMSIDHVVPVPVCRSQSEFCLLYR